MRHPDGLHPSGVPAVEALRFSRAVVCPLPASDVSRVAFGTREPIGNCHTGTVGFEPTTFRLEVRCPLALAVQTRPCARELPADLARVSTIRVARERPAPHWWRSARRPSDVVGVRRARVREPRVELGVRAWRARVLRHYTTPARHECVRSDLNRGHPLYQSGALPS